MFFLLIYVFFNFYLSSSNLTSSPKKTLLEDKGNFCLGIAEKSVANRQAIVEFQKYEILGDKAMVMRKCMEDNGFEENPAWLIENKKTFICNAPSPSNFLYIKLKVFTGSYQF